MIDRQPTDPQNSQAADLPEFDRSRPVDPCTNRLCGAADSWRAYETIGDELCWDVATGYVSCQDPGTGAYIPRVPSRVSRMMSAWPACRAVSSIR
jgi:hypothetical protein